MKSRKDLLNRSRTRAEKALAPQQYSQAHMIKKFKEVGKRGGGTGAIPTIHNGKAAGPDRISAEPIYISGCVEEYHRKSLGGRSCAGRLERRILSQITYLEKGMEAEMAAKGFNFSGLEKMAQNRVRWKHIVDCLCSTPE